MLMRLEAEPGERIDQALKDSLYIARGCKVAVEFDFNNVKVLVLPTDTYESALHRFHLATAPLCTHCGNKRT